MTGDDERGSASLWVVTGGALVLVIALLAVARGSAVLARERAEATADFAALSGADGIGVDANAGDVCRRAATVALANGARLSRCAVRLGADGRTGTVDVTVAERASLMVVGAVVVHASARAGRLPWNAVAMSRPGSSRSGG